MTDHNITSYLSTILPCSVLSAKDNSELRRASYLLFKAVMNACSSLFKSTTPRMTRARLSL